MSQRQQQKNDVDDDDDELDWKTRYANAKQKKNDKTTGYYWNKCPRLTSHIRLNSHHIASQLTWKSWNHLTPFFLGILNFFPSTYVTNSHSHMNILLFIVFSLWEKLIFDIHHMLVDSSQHMFLFTDISTTTTKKQRLAEKKKTNFRYFTSTFFGCTNSRWIIYSIFYTKRVKINMWKSSEFVRFFLFAYTSVKCGCVVRFLFIVAVVAKRIFACRFFGTHNCCGDSYTHTIFSPLYFGERY